MATVGFVGLGAMGKGMAACLAAFIQSGKNPSYSVPLLVQNRTASVAEEFAAATPGCQAVAGVAGLASASLVFAMLANDEATDAALSEFLAVAGQAAAPSQPRIFVNCATVLPSTVTRQAAQAAAAGVLYVNCPVFGRPDAAAAGSLVAVPAGPEEARERVAGLLPAFAGRGVWDLGADPAASAALKLTGNFWIVSQIELSAQCLALATKNGIEDGHVLRMLETFLSSPIPMGYAKRISAGDYSAETGFAVDLALKDVGHMRTLARDSTCPLPFADTAFNHLLHAKAKHGSQLDWGAIHLAVRDSAGLPPNSTDGSQ